MNETSNVDRGNGWKWVALVLAAGFVLMVTCACSGLWGGLLGYAIGKGSAERVEILEPPSMEPWEMPFEFEPGPELPEDLDEMAWLGVEFLTREDGAEVADVVPDGPADEAGIEIGDLIIEVDGEAVTPSYPLHEHIFNYRPGDRIEITLLRDGRERIVDVRLRSRADSGLNWEEQEFFYYQEPLIPDMEG